MARCHWRPAKVRGPSYCGILWSDPRSDGLQPRSDGLQLNSEHSYHSYYIALLLYLEAENKSPLDDPVLYKQVVFHVRDHCRHLVYERD